MTELPRVHGVIPAAGIGLRMAADQPKQYLKLLNRPILQWTLEKLAKLNLESIAVALAPDDEWFESIPNVGQEPDPPSERDRGCLCDINCDYFFHAFVDRCRRVIEIGGQSPHRSQASQRGILVELMLAEQVSVADQVGVVHAR